ncbi:integrase domain-containing protein [Undibacterium oligocarboniphilum]|uniref:Integrase domain-containing protein n=1 Tax=Undibacterium oligocarboniphilum TaxID=666702 RepID=A0A850QRF0_9BURK|nr:integrase domain-containing protein [Undibacterium oligocarboniphilum]MBC3871470.1 integrase domain-containing protein [Undibacterium oligocarboniphilum]NVO78954.1 integrase domain-containing protein [Undibacterium oligocarboniphilum]
MAISYKHSRDVETAKLPAMIKEELKTLFDQHLDQPHSRTRQSYAKLGIKTQRLRCLNLVASIEELINHGRYEITTLRKLKEKHIEYLLKRWVEKNQTKGTIENKMTYLATLCQWIGKSNIIKSSSNYKILETLPARSGTTLSDKSWETFSLDAAGIIAQIATENKYIGIQMMLQMTFGLRVEESVLLRPYDVVMRLHGETYLMIVDGTKGGRPRRIEVQDERQLEIIELAKKYVNGKSKTTIPEEYTLVQWKRLYHNLVRKYGITKKGLGVTSHGLRHQYLNNLYQTLTDHASPVRGGDKPAEDLLQQAKKIIAEHAGHSVEYKANAYIGSHRSQIIKTSASLTDAQIRKALEDNGGNKMQAAEQLKCARSYLYKRLQKMQIQNHTGIAGTDQA